MKILKKSVLPLLIFMILCILQITPAFAAKTTETEYAYLYFYTIDGDEIESLTRKIKVGQKITFKDPDDYKYNVYKDSDGGVIRGEKDDLYDTVNGIEWWDETDTDNIKKYKAGDRWSAGEATAYFFRVHTDNPGITGENVAIATDKDMVYLSFFNQDMEPIEEEDGTLTYDAEITTKDTFIFPDPKEVCDNGTYWVCTTDDGKTSLWKAGSKVKFDAGSYEFHIATDDPVTVTFYYPFGVDIVVDAFAGGQYGQTMTAKVGESITLYKSPGAIVWGCTFKGWTVDDSDDEKVYSGGTSFKITDNQDIGLSMVYEEDENWDPYAKDENGELINKQELMNTSENINELGGTGYDTHIDSSGRLSTTYTKKRVNSGTVLYGVPSTYKKSQDLTSLKNGGDAKDVGSYTKDKYGYDMDKSKITDPNLGDVLKQDNSAQMMDVYGNSMMYHSDLSRLDDMCVAWIRLYEMKNSVPSFVSMIKDWDQTEIDRFEAIEFALISQEYPGKENSLYKRFNSTTDAEVIAAKKKGTEFAPIESATLPEWKDEYMSEKAFNMLKYTKTIFSGWANSYDDGVYEAYKGTGGSIHQVAASIQLNSFMQRFANTVNKSIYALATRVTNSTNKISSTSLAKSISGLFVIEARAETNDLGTAKQYGSHITHGLDNETQIFRRQFFNKSKISRYSAYSFGSLEGLTVTQTLTLQVIYNFLTSNGFSPAMAAGACGNLWQECNFEYTDGLTGKDKSYVGLIQWGGNRKTALKNYAASQGGSAADLNIQLGYLLQELNSGYLGRMNSFISSHSSGQTAATVTNVQLATDAWAIYVEGCVCNTSSGIHSSHNAAKCAFAANGISYQELGTRRAYAENIYAALTFATEDFSGDGAIITPLTQYALSLITTRSGYRYVYGGKDLATGIDCSGFAAHVLNKFGATPHLPTGNAEAQSALGTGVTVNPAYMRPGDLVFYKTNNGKAVGHVAIYIGNGLIVGAQSSKTGIATAQWNYNTKIVCVRRFFNTGDTAVTEIKNTNSDADSNTDDSAGSEMENQ